MKKNIGMTVVKWVAVVFILAAFGMKFGKFSLLNRAFRSGPDTMATRTEKIGENGNTQQGSIHQTYRFDWATLSKDYCQAIHIDSDAGENIPIQPADKPVKYVEQVNGEREFPMDLDFGVKAADHRTTGQVHTIAFRANGDDQVGRKIV